MEKAVLITDTHLSINTIDINKSIFSQVEKYCLANKIKTIYHLGDWLTDRTGTQPLSVLLALYDILEMFERSGINIISIVGNHDKVQLNEDSSYLHLFRKFKNFSLVENVGRCNLGNSHILLLSYFKEIDKYPNEIEKIVNTIALETKKDNAKYFLFTHVTFDETIKNIIGKTFDFVAIGHYHDVEKLENNAHYIGSAYQSNFGENNDKGFVVLSENGTFERVKLSFPQYKTIEVDVENIENISLETLKQQVLDGERVRLVVSGDKDKLDALNTSKIKQLGIKLEKETNEIYKNIEISLTEKVETITTENIVPKYEKFCKKEGIESEIGIKLLKNI